MNLMPVEMFDHVVINSAGKPWAVFELSEPKGMTSYRFHPDAAVVSYAVQILSWVRGLPLESRLLSVATPITADELRAAVASAPHLIAEVSGNRHAALAEQAELAGVGFEQVEVSRSEEGVLQFALRAVFPAEATP